MENVFKFFKYMKTNIIIGRFQTPYLHAGHLHLIATAIREGDKVVILLGTPRSITDKNIAKNPYTIHERMDTIEKIFPQVRIHVLYDIEDDDIWSENVDFYCNKYENPTLYHSRDSFKDYYKGKIPLKEVPEIPGLSATQIRESLNM